MKNMKYFYFAIAIFLTTVAAYALYTYKMEEKRINHSINQALVRAVKTAAVIIGDSYHDQILSKPPTRDEEMYTIQLLSKIAENNNVIYVYSMVFDENKTMHFTSSSALSSEIETGVNLTHFYDKYEPNVNIIKAFETNKMVLDMQELTDQWGTFRSVYIPYATPKGNRYIIGADITVNSIEDLSRIATLKVIIATIALMLSGVPFLFSYRYSLKADNMKLKQEVAFATEKLRGMNEILEKKVEERTLELVAQSYQDALTCLPNRNRLMYDMKQRKYDILVIINMHNFKEINDFFGVEIGDDLLKQMAQWLLSLKIYPYRLNGDEFVIIAKQNLSESAIRRQFKGFIHRLNRHNFTIGEIKINLNVTIGVAQNIDNISLAHADIALHKAKESGKVIAFYDHEQHIETIYQQNILMSAQIKDAINDDRIVCYYQPIVSIATGKIHKYETLVRMIDNNAQVISPSEFLPIAHKTRAYLKITQLVVMKACEMFSNRTEEFSINLSIQDITHSETIAYIEKTIIATNTARQVVFEILESEEIENYEEVLRFIQRMKSLGAKIAIDDFGTGYSSFANIIKLDIDYIKIDGSLIQNVLHNPKHALVVEAIANFAEKIGAQTIAEYVSSAEILEFVTKANITFSQGYYTGKPEPYLQ
ncbi:MAG: EAL domain-containing protein [Sulfurimonas sp.]|nr:EAL domain-containing protein [Sulfurimonas sp.]